MKSKICPYRRFCHSIGDCENCDFGKAFKKLSGKIKRIETKNEALKKENEELTYKLECLLCHATGGKLSKSTYTLRTMETVVTDYIQESCDEAQAEAVKEFAERAKEKMQNLARMEYGSGEIYFLIGKSFIDNLVKEMTGEAE